MKARLFTLLIALAFLSSISSSCSPRFSETIPIRVVDYSYRPIEGAMVSVYYQISGALLINGTTPNYMWSPEVPTDAHGLAKIWLHNQEENPDLVDCDIKIRVRYAGYEEIIDKDKDNKRLNLDRLPKEVLVRLPASQLKIRVTTDKRVYLPFTYIIGPLRGEAFGTTIIPLPEGRYSVYIIHKGMKKKFNVDMVKTEDYLLDVVYRYVWINFSVFDEQGNPVNYTLKLDTGDVFRGRGHEEFKILAGVHTATLEVGNEKRTISINPAIQVNYEIYLDHTPPEISNIRVDFFNNKTIITLTAEDKGRFASGVSRVYMTLYFQDGTIINKELSKGVFNDYRAEVAKIGNFNFVIRAYDKAGNSIEVRGKQEISVVPAAPKKRGDSTGILIIVVVLAALVGLGWYVKKKLEESEEI